MRISLALALSGCVILLLDALFGDPAAIPHPVVLMGKAISFLEKKLRAAFPKTERGERAGGTCLSLILLAGTFGVSAGLLVLAVLIHPAVLLALELFWGWQCLAMRGLIRESRGVQKALERGTIDDARRAVARIVGRDTKELDASGVTRAAVETVAENFSDGVIAPLFWFLIGGAAFSLCYKAINTMDSMLGYRNERYLNFGRFPAKLDDAANYLPSRIAALLLILAAGPCGESVRGARRIWRRDRRNHASPNSAQTESAMAGALGVRLGGPASYFGEIHDKPTIGDPDREIRPDDIRRANRMMAAASVFGAILLGAARVGIAAVIFMIRAAVIR